MPETSTGGRFATFFIEDLLFGVAVCSVQEVLRYQEMTTVPRAPEMIEGLINLRGQIFTAIDMRRLLGLQSRPSGQLPMNMVIRTNDGAVSLLVDEIGEVLEMDPTAFEPPPENLDAASRSLISGIYKLEDRLLLILDEQRTSELEAPAMQN